MNKILFMFAHECFYSVQYALQSFDPRLILQMSTLEWPGHFVSRSRTELKRRRSSKSPASERRRVNLMAEVSSRSEIAARDSVDPNRYLCLTNAVSHVQCNTINFINNMKLYVLKGENFFNANFITFSVFCNL